MDKKYLVFVSSTYEDLKEERSAVMQVLLESDAIPTGMELFPATHDDKWELIKEVIQQCDYYVLISAGKYGSIDKNGNSFTENEYDYAISINKPVISFLYEDIKQLKGLKLEDSDNGKQKLDNFRSKLKKENICSFWTNTDNLKHKVSSSFYTLRQRKPAVGWVRSDQKNPETTELVLELKTENEELKKKVMDLSKSNELDLADGEDVVEIFVELLKTMKTNTLFGNTESLIKTDSSYISWKDLFRLLPNEIYYNAINISSFEYRVNQFLLQKYIDSNSSEDINKARIKKESLFKIIFQFTILNYIESDGLKISLSEYGKKKFTELNVVKKCKG